MTSLREMIARIISRDRAKPDLPDPNFDYRVFWTKRAMAWPTERQEMILAAIQSLKNRADLTASQSDRRYRLEGLDDERYSGASMIALETVLRAILNIWKDESIDE